MYGIENNDDNIKNVQTYVISICVIIYRQKFENKKPYLMILF